MKAANVSAGYSEYDVCVPMIDKVVDGNWKRETSTDFHTFLYCHIVLP